jgi:hypothetical protein
MSTEKKSAQPIGPPRRGRKLGKRSSDDYTRTRPYIRRDTLRQVQIELKREKQCRQPITEFSELVEALLDELLSYNEPARKGTEK